MRVHAERRGQERGVSWLVVGCFTIILLVVVLIAASYLALRAQVRRFTEEQPRQLPKVQLTDNELSGLKSRLEQFNVAAKAGQDAVLELTEKELNGWIQSRGEFEQKGIRVYVVLKDGSMVAQVSLPLDPLGISMLKGRYFNGEFELVVKSTMPLVLELKSAKAKGEPLPGNIMGKLERRNFAEELEKRPDVAKMLKNTESVEITEGKIRIKLKAKPKS